MGFHNGAKVVNDSLVFALDAGNPKCFSDGDTTATCLVSGSSVTGASGQPNTGTHTPNTANFPAYSSIKGGVFNFAGGRGMNIEDDLGAHSATSWCLWFNKNNGSTHYFFDCRNGGGSWQLSNYQNRSINWESDIEYNPGGTAGDSDYVAQPAMYGDVWNYLVVTSDSSGGKMYLNGAEVSLTQASSATETFGKNMRIGTRYTTTGQWTGHMGCIQLYSKVLSAAEVLQNYDAQKGRFI